MRRALPLLLSLSALLPRYAQADDRVPIAVMDLSGRGVDAAAAAALTTEVGNSLSRSRVFRVITREDIKRMLQLEQTRQQCTGETDAACMAEIGGALGVDYLVYGEVAKIGGTYSLSLTLLDIGKAEASNRANKKISDPGKLLEQTDLATKLLVQPLLANKRAFLVLNMREVGAKVTVDGRLRGLSPIGRMELTMGAHEVVVEKEGFLPWARTVDLPPDQATVESVTLVPSEAFIAEYRSSAERVRTIAWATAGAGALMLGTGLTLRLIADARFDDLASKRYISRQPNVCAEFNPQYAGENYCPTSLGYQNNVIGEIDSIETQDTIALVSLFAGGATAIVSAVLFAVGDDPQKYQTFGQIGLSNFHVGPNGLGFSTRW